MLNSGEKKILTLVLSEKKFPNETKKHTILCHFTKSRGIEFASFCDFDIWF
jgi:hypothetical protein